MFTCVVIIHPHYADVENYYKLTEEKKKKKWSDRIGAEKKIN